MTKSRGIRAPYQEWSEEQLAALRARYPNERSCTIAADLGRAVSSIYKKAQVLGLKKSAAFLSGPDAGRTDGRRGGEARFKPGHSPANKGLRRPGWAPGRMAETQFKKGERRGVAVRLYQPIGTELRQPAAPKKEIFHCLGCGRFLSVTQFYCGDCPGCGADNRP